MAFNEAKRSYWRLESGSGKEQNTDCSSFPLFNKMASRYSCWKMMFSSHHPATLPPLLVTIGPQCAGKTTYLSNIPHVIDITMDDQPFTYAALPKEGILRYIKHRRSEFNSCAILNPSLNSFLRSPERDRRVFGKYLYENRVAELLDSEQLLLLQRFTDVNLHNAYLWIQTTSHDLLYRIYPIKTSLRTAINERRWFTRLIFSHCWSYSFGRL